MRDFARNVQQFFFLMVVSCMQGQELHEGGAFGACNFDGYCTQDREEAVTKNTKKLDVTMLSFLRYSIKRRDNSIISCFKSEKG